MRMKDMKVFTLIFGISMSLFVGACFIIAAMPNSRMTSRLTSSELRLELPKDFGNPISFSTGRGGEKDLFYHDNYGNLKVKTYTDTGFLESEIVFIRDKK